MKIPGVPSRSSSLTPHFQSDSRTLGPSAYCLVSLGHSGVCASAPNRPASTSNVKGCRAASSRRNQSHTELAPWQLSVACDWWLPQLAGQHAHIASLRSLGDTHMRVSPPESRNDRCHGNRSGCGSQDSHRSGIEQLLQQTFSLEWWL